MLSLTFCGVTFSTKAKAFRKLAPGALAAGLVALGMIATAQAAGAVGSTVDLGGVWLTQSGDTRVRLSPCGPAYCGVIVWTRNGGNDEKNPDAAKRGRSLTGVQMISGMKKGGDGNYAGELYNYLDGKTYTGKMTPISETELQLKGCVMGGLICKSQTWKRVQ